MKSAAVAIALLFLSSCAAKEGPKPEAPAARPAPAVQIANPVSVNCEQKGGKLEIVDTPQGQQRICVLPDGTRCDEWAYFRGECPPEKK
jgi:putative hemolysin